jgi:hypothetical protein
VKSRDSLWWGLLAGGTVNASIGSLALWYAVFMSFGAGLSSNLETNRTVLGSIRWVGLCCPACANLPGILFGLLGPRWKFLGGGAAGFLAGAFLVALQAGLVALYVALLANRGG